MEPNGWFVAHYSVGGNMPIWLMRTAREQACLDNTDSWGCHRLKMVAGGILSGRNLESKSCWSKTQLAGHIPPETYRSKDFFTWLIDDLTLASAGELRFLQLPVCWFFE